MKIRQKLQSGVGASLLIAMVFMLVCTFVGGSVLAAATANMKHLKTMTGDQQDMLSQRSAVSLLISELGPGTSKGMIRMTVEDDDVIGNKYTVGEGGVKVYTGETSSFNIVTFTFSRRNYTTMQRLMLESAVLCYMDKYDVDPSSIVLNNFNTGDETITSVDQFWLSSYTGGADGKNVVYITDPLNPDTTTEFSVSCSAGENDTFSFYVSIADKNYSQARLTCHAKITPRGTHPSNVEDDENLTDELHNIETTYIDWEAPKITKGA